jgi:hypothetical protein
MTRVDKGRQAVSLRPLANTCHITVTRCTCCTDKDHAYVQHVAIFTHSFNIGIVAMLYNSHLLEVAGALAREGLQCALAPLKHQHRGGVGGTARVAHLKHRHKLAGGAWSSSSSSSRGR